MDRWGWGLLLLGFVRGVWVYGSFLGEGMESVDRYHRLIDRVSNGDYVGLAIFIAQNANVMHICTHTRTTQGTTHPSANKSLGPAPSCKNSFSCVKS